MVNYAHLSDTQFLVAFALGFIPIILSLLGSFTILYLLYKSGVRKRFYHRLICGLSVMDIIMTTAALFQPFLTRSDIGLRFAIGNATSCEWTAFFFHFFLGAAIYNAALSIYYLLLIRYRMTEETAARYMEPWVHIAAVGIPSVLGSVALAKDYFNPGLVLSGVCEMTAFPADCVLRDDVECERGESMGTTLAIHLFFYVGSAITGFVATFMVYWTVRAQAQQTVKYSFTGELSEAQRRRVRAVGTQAILYACAFFNSFAICVALVSATFAVFVPEIKSGEGLEEKSGVFPLTILLFFFFLIQGCTYQAACKMLPVSTE